MALRRMPKRHSCPHRFFKTSVHVSFGIAEWLRLIRECSRSSGSQRVAVPNKVAHPGPPARGRREEFSLSAGPRRDLISIDGSNDGAGLRTQRTR